MLILFFYVPSIFTMIIRKSLSTIHKKKHSHALTLPLFTIILGIYTRVYTDAVAKDLTSWATCVSQGGADCRQRKTLNGAPNLVGFVNAVR